MPSIDIAADKLLSGEVVAFPTETVYGLGAVADLELACRQVYQLKNRPPDHPVILHVKDVDAISRWVDKIPDYALELAMAYWPGPLTLILPKSYKVPKYVNANMDAIAIRVPSHHIAQELLHKVDRALIAPSANLYSRVSPTSKEMVAKYFPDLMCLDGGQCQVGIESTIISCLQKQPELVRPGHISVEEIQEKLSIDPIISNRKIKASGNKKLHYSPEGTLILFKSTDPIPKHAIVITWSGIKHENSIEIPADPKGYAKQLYAKLACAERKGELIYLEVPEGTSKLWEPVWDRITRAGTAID